MTAADPIELRRQKTRSHLPWRRGIARILYSPAGRFRTIVFQAGQTRRVGRDERSDVRIADPALRGSHFELYFDGLRFHAKDLTQDGGLSIDGRPARFGEIASGGFVTAGSTTLRLFVERTTPAPEREEPASPSHVAHVEAALAQLGPARQTWTLYGVFDAARDPRIRVLLGEGIDDHASLYEGAEGAVLDEVAPYLVRFAPDSALLERIVDEGWGRSWGIFVRSSLGAKDVRRHFRRFLMVAREETSERLYFRFYDPRVLRDFHAIATPRQRHELLAGLDEVWLEAEDGAPLQLVAPPSAGSQSQGG